MNTFRQYDDDEETVNMGTTYYVSNAGNDANDGLSPGTSWAHHPWMSTWAGAVVLKPGDIICMNRGDIWTIAAPIAPYMEVQQSGVSGNHIKTTCYGVGNRPVINISTDSAVPVIRGLGHSYITFDSLEITHFDELQDTGNEQDGITFGKDAGLNVPHDWKITNCVIHHIPRQGIFGRDDSYNIIIGDIQACGCATNMFWSNHIYDCGYAGVMLFGRNPVTNNSNWYVCYNYIHHIDFTGGALRDAYGIALSMSDQGAGQDQSDGWPAYGYVLYNLVEDVPNHEGIDTHGGNYLYFNNNRVYNCQIGFALNTAVAGVYEAAVLNHCYCENNVIEQPGNHAISDFGFIWLQGDDTTHRPTNCEIKNNTCFYTARPNMEAGSIGIYLYNVDGVLVERNRLYNGNTGVSAGAIKIGGGANLAKNVIVRKNWIFEWGRAMYHGGPAVDGDCEISNNIVYSNEEALMADPGAFDGNQKIYNNIFFTTIGAASPYAADMRNLTVPVGHTLYFKNNIVGAEALGWMYYIMAPGTINGTFDCDYNLHWHSNKGDSMYAAGAARTLAQWRALGYDVNSPNVLESLDPLFTNGSGTYNADTDFRTLAASPARGAGVAVGLTDDYWDDLVNVPPDIGAYQS